jgi:hypothetical protein
MTLWGLLSFAAGGAWLFWGFFIGREWGSLGLLIGLVAGSCIGVGTFWGTDRAGDWLLSRLDLDQASTPFKRALSSLYDWLLLLGAIAWIVISHLLAFTIMSSLFRLNLPAVGRAAWEVALSAGVVYLARHPAQAVFGALIYCAMLVLLSYLIFDRLLRIQSSSAHSDWERQGRLSGYFWSAPGSRETSRHERGALYYDKWLFDPPEWVKGRASFWRWLGLVTLFALVPAVPVLLYGIPAMVLSFLGLR